MEQLINLNNAVNADIIASGGIRNLSDIIACRDNNMYGAICGKSIYKGTLNLREAVKNA